MSEKVEGVRVRFAPSPTGYLHIGGTRTAIFNWLFARHHGGEFLVRIEDTDLQRSKKEYVDSILQSLEWLGIQPDEPLVYQATRVSEYKKVIDEMLEQGLAYPCFCEPKAADEKVKNLEKGIVSHYPGTCRDKKSSREDLAKPHAIRFKLPTDKKAIKFTDIIRGEISVDIDQLDDFVIFRRDGMPTYNFCVVVDDSAMKISHVIRGEDHISNTPKQILLYEALGKTVPKFAHLPLILGPSGGKLSKRDAAVSTIEYQKDGYLSGALFNYLVRLGWAHGDQEIFSKEEMIKFFTLDKVGKKGAIFDTKKLLWLNGVYIRELTLEKFREVASELNNDKLKTLTKVWGEARLGSLFELYGARATLVSDLIENMVSFGSAPEELDVGLIKKWVTAQTPDLLKSFLERVENDVEVYNHENLLELARHVCGEFGVKLVALAQPLRLALTGGTSSPGIFELIELLRLEETQKRISRLIEELAQTESA